MTTYADKNQENKTNPLPSALYTTNGTQEPDHRFKDNRAEAVRQRTLQEIIELSPQVKQSQAIQLRADTSDRVKASLQLQARATTQVIQKQQAVKKTSGGAPLPDDIKFGVENLSGYAMDDVEVHYNSSKPSKLNALAYAQGTEIHIASGQEKHVPHEAWHVVQQKQGRVKSSPDPTSAPINTDLSLEKEADVMGAKALSAHAHSSENPSTNRELSQKEPLQMVVQLKRIVPRAINGLTHLVKMTKEGHIYNENYLENEEDEVHFGDLLLVDVDNSWYSRRGMNQEINALRDRDAEATHLWMQAVQLNNVPLEDDIYVRAEMLKEPILIHEPRQRGSVDDAIENVKIVLEKLKENVLPKDHYPFDAIRVKLIQNVKLKLISKSADSTVNFQTIGEQIEQAINAGQKLFDTKQVDEKNYPILKDALLRVQTEFQRYSEPKKKGVVGGLIGRKQLQGLGVTGLDLGGIGLKSGYLDVNVEDTINNPNHLLIGDAMNLQASFEPGCVNDVIAELLPLVLMVKHDTKEERMRAIELVLSGVNYVTNNGGKASIQFNDNSGEAVVGEAELLHIAGTYHFRLENNNPISKYRSFTFHR